MSKPQPEPARRLFVLDANVLIHDPTALFRFDEHDVHLPMRVLEDLDRAQRGNPDVASSARQASRFLDELLAGADKAAIDRGLTLPGSDGRPSGRLFFHAGEPGRAAAAAVTVLDAALALRDAHPDDRVTLVSKDINVRIKATVAGLRAEDFHNDRVLDDVDLLYRGVAPLSAEVWRGWGDAVAASLRGGRDTYRVPRAALDDAVGGCYPNQGLYLDDDAGDENAAATLLVRELDADSALLEKLDQRRGDGAVWGVSARNREQDFALNLLLDPQIDFVSLLGVAGTGKTLLALAAGLSQTLDEQRYHEIIMTRVTVSVGEDIGFLPGTEEEKMTPWMGALLDNLEVLTAGAGGGEWGRAATNDLISKRVKIRSLNFMRGRTFQNKYLIIDEAQNLTAKQMKTLITRAGPGTKVVCLGNVAQIDTPYLSETTSGLTYVVDRFKRWAHSGHVTLLRGERSRLAEFASDRL